MSLFARLRANAGADWSAYVGHAFVTGLGDGTLPQAAFRRYLTQDYLFLIQFARAAALAAYKSDTLDELRAAAATLSGLLDLEMPLHVTYCAGWGLDEAALQAEPEALETIAYTRFVLERGLAGDRLDLETALAPCVLGYGEIGRRLHETGGIHPANPYADWIATYAGAEYCAVADAAEATLETLWASRGSEARYPSLLETFRAATRLETAFWDMGLRGAAPPL
jgi:thiaminase/transcriptional activator TenA